MNEPLRSENEAFKELEQLCISPGYLHAIAHFCFRDNTIGYDNTMTAEDVLQQFSADRLVRTEISTLIGLACKTNVNFDHPGAKKIQDYIDRTDALLKELHTSMMPRFDALFDLEKISDPTFNPFREGKALRESIFYGGESAYGFQYRDLSLSKYKNDNDWFLENKGYTIEQAVHLISTLCQMQNDNINNALSTFHKKHPDGWTLLPAYTFSTKELAAKAGLNIKIATDFIDSFSVSEPVDKGVFLALDDFNPLNAYPIIKVEDEYLLFQAYSLVSALYETPFFWFNKDESYKAQARKNRGLFAESFSEERLKIVFGKDRVFTNVEIYKGKKTRVGEIDVLVVFGNRAIVLQAKSKKLTVPARKGNDNALQDDFKGAVQDAYNQAYSCAQFLTNKDMRLVGSDGAELDIKRNFREIFPFCVTSEHYPALSFQARLFLNYQTTEKIKPPFVMDVFLLDVMTEMLSSPLQFLSYINRRVEYGDRILSGHELTILAYHLKQNLWMANDISMLQLCDDIGTDLDLAMLVRRDGISGKDTPDGILTRYINTTYGRLINEIDSLDEPATIDLGFMLLSLDGDTIEHMNDGIGKICRLSLRDNQHHDLTLGIGAGETGITIHCNTDLPDVALPRLKEHCRRRKYTQKALSWFGLCIDPKSKKIKFGFELNFAWQKSDKMDELIRGMSQPQKLRPGKTINFNAPKKRADQVGRNDPCPCGSGKKYKKCCLNT